MDRMNLGLWLNNSSEAALGRGRFERRNPITKDLASVGAAANADDVSRAVESAHQAFATWSEVGPHARRAILNACADALEARTEDFVEVGIAETGATKAWIESNVMRGAITLREAASLTTYVRGEIIPCEKPHTEAYAVRAPLGVLVGMAPWNSPVILGVRSFAMPIACGNTVVMKASEKCPGMHLLIAEAMAEGGLPPGVLNVLTHSSEDGPEVVDALIAHPLTRRINFTGSTRVGRIIAQKAANVLKPCLLELGGKSPLIVLNDADIEGAVNAAAFGAFNNQGQICMSTERVIVDDKIAGPFSEAFTRKARSLKSDAPQTGAPLAAVIDVDTVRNIRRLVDDAVAKGAEVLTGEVYEESTIMQPMIIDGVTTDMAIYHEETFGPITTLVRARDTEHAITIANDTEFGLTAAVHGSDRQRALAVAKRLKTGMVHINGPTVFDEPQMPFGGTKDSGYGRFGGTAAIHEFTELRLITVGDPQQAYPI